MEAYTPEEAHVSEAPHTLDARLANDTLPLGQTALSHVLLARDGRWPWIILVPRRQDVAELHELSPQDLSTLMQEVATTSRSLQQATGCHKVNVAAIGNIVRQLHVHVVARHKTDAAWPGPIWGVGVPESRLSAPLPDFAEVVKTALMTRQLS